MYPQGMNTNKERRYKIANWGKYSLDTDGLPISDIVD